MCTSWAKNLLILGVLASFFHPWLVVIAIYPVLASLASRITHRNWWPALSSCQLATLPADGKDGSS